MTQATFRVWRGGREGGELKDYTTDVTEGMVVLDAMHQIQAESASDLAHPDTLGVKDRDLFPFGKRQIASGERSQRDG